MRILFDTEPFASSVINNMLFEILFEIKSDILNQLKFTNEELKITGVLVVIFRPGEYRLDHFAFDQSLVSKVLSFIKEFNLQPSIEKVKNIRAN